MDSIHDAWQMKTHQDLGKWAESQEGHTLGPSILGLRPGRIFRDESKSQFQRNLETEKPKQEPRHKDKTRDSHVTRDGLEGKNLA